MASAVPPLHLNVVKKYAPEARFHSTEEYYPCSIEYMCSGSILKHRKWALGNPINNQHCTTPIAITFLGYYTLVYKSYDSNDIWVTRTRDPTNSDGWELFRLDGQSTDQANMGACFFNGKLWVVYSSNSHLRITWTSDCQNWSRQEIPSWRAYGVTMTVLGDKMYMAYKSYNSNHMKWGWTNDGTTWIDMGQVRGRESTKFPPAMITLADTIICIFSSSAGNDGQLRQCRYKENGGWTESQTIPNQFAWQVALAKQGNKLYMAYSAPHSDHFYISDSVDGINWNNRQEIPEQGSVPGLVSYQWGGEDKIWLSWCGTDRDKQFNNTYLDVDLSYNFSPIPRPTQDQLQTNNGSNFYLSVEQSVWHGQPLGQAPTYFAVTEGPDAGTVTIHYIFLYAFQNAQGVKVDGQGVILTHFDCFIWDIGSHQGDIERFAVKLKQDTQAPDGWSPQEAIFEAHGRSRNYPWSSIQMVESTHPGMLKAVFSLKCPHCTNIRATVVSVGLAGHGNWNREDKKDNPIVSDPSSDIIDLTGVVKLSFGDFVNDLKVWPTWKTNGSDFRQLGLDTRGQPINDQKWAAFAGRLGDSAYTTLVGASYTDGSRLNIVDSIAVNAIFGVASAFNRIPSKFKRASGSLGPATRSWIQNPVTMEA
ncbi:hypothetical protein H2198_008298 [Neophaeococcomyces mojaviensis]|uniref:Uncharacterized protein n=1 Tax=Neophaeococcomyces mojaviensis TaxID=3383035 RepID=A0ACC2ZXX0_9EURO|nr:hypothetical protein H2198_008298 [Knufia sp. JES_112]